MLFSPKPYQVKPIRFITDNPYTVLSLDMGLGKTFTSLYAAEKCGGTIGVICPAYLIPTWKLEMEKYYAPGTKNVTFFEKGSQIYKVWDSDIVVTSFDLAQKNEHLFEWTKNLIVDEAHELKSMGAKRTQFIHKSIFENSVPRVTLLTGTPIKNRVEEYYSLIAMCNYNPELKKSEFLKKFPDSITFADYFSFRREYTIEINGKYVRIVKWEGLRPRKIGELRNWLKTIYTRVDSEDVLNKEIITKDILISDSPNLGLLKEFNTHYAVEDNHGVSPTLKKEAALKKVPFTVNYAKKLLEEINCVVIYTDHVDSCNALAAAFGVTPIHGQLPVKKRQEIGVAFQKGESKVIVATIKSFSQGIDLTRSHNLIFNDMPWVPGDEDQAIKRIVRMNQDKDFCVVHRIFGSPQDAAIAKAVNEKRKVIRRVV